MQRPTVVFDRGIFPVIGTGPLRAGSGFYDEKTFFTQQDVIDGGIIGRKIMIDPVSGLGHPGQSLPHRRHPFIRQL